MASSVAKQYLSIDGETVLSRSIQRVLAVPGIEQVVVAIAAHDSEWSRQDIAEHPKVTTVTGGRERADSVLAGLVALEARAASDDWVLVHDAARPCVESREISAMCEALSEHAVGGIMAVPVADTVKRANQQQSIEQTIERRGLWVAQTPQLFRYQLLKESLRGALAAGVAITDEASALEWAGYQPQLFQGSKHNIKITVAEDIHLATMILAAQKESL